MLAYTIYGAQAVGSDDDATLSPSAIDFDPRR